jgi:methylthioribulose-1-phosphate dehydratase
MIVATHTDHRLASVETPSEPRQLDELIGELCETGRMFHYRGWSLGTSSNYSIVLQRDPLELLITASGKDKGRLSARDFVRVDSHGRPCVSGQARSSAETLLHCVIAKRDDVGAVLHTHSVWATLLSDWYFADGGFMIEDYEMLKGLDGVSTHEDGEWIEILDNSQDMSELSQRLESRFDDVDCPIQHGFLLRQHGLYTWGRDLESARRHVEILEFLFECVARKLTLRLATPV